MEIQPIAGPLTEFGEPGDGERLLGVYAATRDPRLRAEIAAIYDRFATGLARRLATRRESREDLMQVARIGLLHAIDRFDPARRRPFTAFARVTIEGELKRHVRDATWRIHVPRQVQEHYLEVIKAVDVLTQELGRSPRIPEVADRIGLSEDQVLEAMEVPVSNSLLSLDSPGGATGSGPSLDRGSDDVAVDTVEERAVLRALLQRVPPQEREILRLYFVEGLSQSEVAARFGVSQMCVSRRVSHTLRRIRGLAGIEHER